MDRNALDWLFSTSPQTIAALVGLIVAGTSFIYGKIDDKIEADTTLAEIGKVVKSRIHLKLQSLLYWAIAVVVIDLLCLFLNPMVERWVLSFRGEFNIYFTFVIVVLSFNVWLLFKTIGFVKVTMNPSFVESIVKDLVNEYNDKEKDKTNIVEIGEFIQHFIQFESLLRHSNLFEDRKDNYQRPLSLFRMVKELFDLGKISKNEYRNILEINRIRNLILHGGDIQKVDKVIDDELQKIIQKLQGILANS